jgi:secondary thiamine-phosphate synthase enzyme
VRIHQENIEIESRPKSLADVTDAVSRVVAKSGIKTGLCTVFIQHTSASLVIQENADRSVQRDLERWMSDLAPEARKWEHDAEGPDDMPSHARSAITKTSETIPVTAGGLALGTWQALYVWEHRARSHRRRLVVHVVGE